MRQMVRWDIASMVPQEKKFLFLHLNWAHNVG